jgi:hypothetical protein
MEPEKIRVLKITEDSKIEIKEISNELRVLQNEVGGSIDIPFISETLNEQGIDVVIDDEGKIKQKPITVAIIDTEGKMIEVIAGPVLFTSHDSDGNTIGLADSQLEYLQSLFERMLITPFGFLYTVKW